MMSVNSDEVKLAGLMQVFFHLFAAGELQATVSLVMYLLFKPTACLGGRPILSTNEITRLAQSRCDESR